MDSEHRPTWQVALLVVATVAVAAVWGVILATGREPDVSQSASFEPSAGPEPPAVLVIGDSYTGGSDMNSGPTWATRLADERGWVPVQDAIGGTGYIQDSELGPSLRSRLERTLADYDPDVVLVAMGLNDSQLPYDTVIDGARTVLRRVDQGFPQADVVVLSPFSPRPLPEVERLEAGLGSVAADLGLPYVHVTDVFYDHPDLIGSDGTHPTDAGHAYLADQIDARLKPALFD